MKQSSPTFKILAGCVLAGILLLFALQLQQYFENPISTTLIYQAETEVTLSTEGWVVREEESLTSPGGTLLHAFTEGEKVGAYQPIATGYSSDGALETVKTLEEKELRLQQLEFALASFLDPDAALKLDSSITQGLLDLRYDVSRGDYSVASEQITELKGNILKRTYAYADATEIQAEIGRVRSEMETLRNSLSGVSVVTSPRPGTYSAACDGYEQVLTPAFLEDLTPSKLDGVTAGEAGGNVGKLLYGDTWYYAFTLTKEDAEQLRKADAVVLRFSKGLRQDTEVEIHSISEVEDGRCAVVLSCDRYLSQVTQLRRQSATLVLESYTGLRIPAAALRLNAEGQSGVYCLVGFNASFKPVEIVYRGDGYTLVRAPELTAGTKLLRAGDEAIVTTQELYDGKVIQ